ncbi:uncharacterized protein LOC136025471 [Artemia franciscana]|uniref:uncharacterized protein LOC136025471 n=1 Tax=Artemia franciscana TaxID=6661 RepID=UPI0032DB1FD4
MDSQLSCHKKGKRNSAANYRPISITSSVVKVIEGIINDTVIKHLEKNGIIQHSQHGFQSGRSVDTNLWQYYNLVTDLIDKGIPVEVVLFDVAKAFDKVRHRRLIVKLHTARTNNRVVGRIKAFLAERTPTGQNIHISWNADLFKFIAIQEWCFQGTILCPTLFYIFINDAPSVVHDYLTLYADDLKLIGGIRNQLDADVYQRDINKLNNWANAWLLSFNTSKYHVLHFGKKNLRFGCTLNDLPLEVLPKDRDLGVLVDKKLKFDSHAAIAASSANQTLGTIKRTISSRSPVVMTTLYKALV